MSDERLLTLTQASSLFEISTDLLREAVRNEDLPSTRGPRNRYEVRAEDVAAWKADRRSSGVMSPERIKAWAFEVAAAAPPVSPELAIEVAMILTRDHGQGVAA